VSKALIHKVAGGRGREDGIGLRTAARYGMVNMLVVWQAGHWYHTAEADCEKEEQMRMDNGIYRCGCMRRVTERVAETLRKAQAA